MQYEIHSSEVLSFLVGIVSICCKVVPKVSVGAVRPAILRGHGPGNKS